MLLMWLYIPRGLTGCRTFRLCKMRPEGLGTAWAHDLLLFRDWAKGGCTTSYFSVLFKLTSQVSNRNHPNVEVLIQFLNRWLWPFWNSKLTVKTIFPAEPYLIANKKNVTHPHCARNYGPSTGPLCRSREGSSHTLLFPLRNHIWLPNVFFLLQERPLSYGIDGEKNPFYSCSLCTEMAAMWFLIFC